MDFKTFFVSNILRGFFMVVTCVCVAMAAIGTVFDPAMRFGYQGFLWPLLFGAAAMLPILVTYSKRELSVREVLVRKLIQLVLIELIVLFIVFSGGSPAGVSPVVSVALSVFLIYTTVNLFLWVGDRNTAKVFNAALLEMHEHED